MKVTVSHHRIIRPSIFALLMFIACPAQGAVVSHPPVLARIGHGSSDCSGFCIPFETADDFLLPTAGRIADLRFWGFPQVGPDDSFAVTFYTNPNVTPPVEGTPFFLDIAHTTAATLLPGSPTEIPINGGRESIFQYDVRLDEPFDALANTTYWMAIFNTGPGSEWVWLTDGEGHVATRNLTPALPYPPRSGNLGWNLERPDAAFEFTTDQVPEPAVAILLTTGIVASVLRYRRMARL